SRKKARNIVVDDIAFHWKASGNDGYISISIWPKIGECIITATLPYYETRQNNGDGTYSLKNQIVITNRMVRKIIKFAQENYSFKPSFKGEIRLKSLDGLILLDDAIRATEKIPKEEN
ncbi:MAG: hypothetical protein AABZ60_17625, partial [Planctomycetota bacterium]